MVEFQTIAQVLLIASGIALLGAGTFIVSSRPRDLLTQLLAAFLIFEGFVSVFAGIFAGHVLFGSGSDWRDRILYLTDLVILPFAAYVAWRFPRPMSPKNPATYLLGALALIPAPAILIMMMPALGRRMLEEGPEAPLSAYAYMIIPFTLLPAFVILWRYRKEGREHKHALTAASLFFALIMGVSGSVAGDTTADLLNNGTLTHLGPDVDHCCQFGNTVVDFRSIGYLGAGAVGTVLAAAFLASGQYFAPLFWAVAFARSAFFFEQRSFGFASGLNLMIVVAIACSLIARGRGLQVERVSPRGAILLTAVVGTTSFVAGSLVVLVLAPDPSVAGVVANAVGLVSAAGVSVVVFPRARALAAHPGRPKADRYRTIRVLGEGGEGRVVLAHDSRLGREIVLKERPSLSAERGVHEAKMLAKLEHPNIVRIYDVEEGNGTLRLAMEHLAGGSLLGRLQRGPMGQAEALRIIDDVLAGLEAAHMKGIVHGDLKPDNILLDGEGRAKVADFGLARDRPAQATIVESGGTVSFMSPEQIRGQAPDKRSDVHAAGVLLGLLLTGRHPLVKAGEDDVTMRLAIAQRAPDLQPLPADGAWAELLGRALAKDPAQRPADASALRDLVTAARGTSSP